MKGYLIELRNYNKPTRVLGSGSLMENATAERRRTMARRLLTKLQDSVVDSEGFFAVEYEADWAECSSPDVIELARYDL